MVHIIWFILYDAFIKLSKVRFPSDRKRFDSMNLMIATMVHLNQINAIYSLIIWMRIEINFVTISSMKKLVQLKESQSLPKMDSGQSI